MLSHVWLFATPWTVARQVPLPMEFSRQEYWSGLPFPPTDPWIKPTSLTLADRFFSTVPPGKSVPSFSLVTVQFSNSVMSVSLQPHRLQACQNSLVYNLKKKKKTQLLVLLNFSILFVYFIYFSFDLCYFLPSIDFQLSLFISSFLSCKVRLIIWYLSLFF